MICRSSISLAVAASIVASAAHASVLSIPWTLDFTFQPAADTRLIATIPGSSTLDIANFATDYEATAKIQAQAKFIVSLASVDVTAGLGFPASAKDSYHVYLPFNVTFTAPDHALPGQDVFVQSSIGFTGAPLFAANGTLSYATDAILHGKASLGPFDGSFNVDSRLPDRITSNGNGLVLGGSGTYSDVDRSADLVASGPFARSTIGGSLPVASSTAKFEGNQLVTDGSIDAQRGSLNLLSILSEIPVIGSAAAAVDAVSDLDLQAGVKLEEKSIVSTGAIYALYTEDSGLGERRATVLNSPGQQGFDVAVPSDAKGSYAIDLYGLGLGLGLERELFLQPELKLVFDPILFGSWTIFEKEFEDALLIGRQQSRIQYEEIFSDPRSARFISPSQRLLSFALDQAAPAPPLTTDPGLAAGLPDAGANQYGTLLLPGTAPTDLVPIYTDVPEPSSGALIVIGLGCAAGWRRGRRALLRLEPGRLTT